MESEKEKEKENLDHPPEERQEGQELSLSAQKEQQACPLGQIWGYLRPTICEVQTRHSSSSTRRPTRLAESSIAEISLSALALGDSYLCG